MIDSPPCTRMTRHKYPTMRHPRRAQDTAFPDEPLDFRARLTMHAGFSGCEGEERNLINQGLYQPYSCFEPHVRSNGVSMRKIRHPQSLTTSCLDYWSCYARIKLCCA